MLYNPQPDAAIFVYLVMDSIWIIAGETMESLGYWLFGLLLVWYIVAQRYSHTKRLNLRSYVLFLLMEDVILENHKAKLKEWIRGSNARTSSELGERAQGVIEKMADTLAASNKEPSLLAAMSMLWNSDAAADLRKKK